MTNSLESGCHGMNETRRNVTEYENKFSVYHFIEYYHLYGMVQDKYGESRKNSDT